MEDQAMIFKNDILRGISLAIKNLQQQDAQVKATNRKGEHPVTKHNLHFRNLLNYLDLAFSFALKDARRGYWPLVKKVAHHSVLDMIIKHPAANTEIKKSYLWLYLTFVENSLLSYVKMMLAETKFIKSHYKRFAILRDMERCEILTNLLVGTETLLFEINIEDPYLDYGHEPLLKQEKVVVHNEASYTPHKNTLQKPDITMIDENSKPCDSYPDLLSEDPSVRKKHHSPSHNIENDDLVYQKPGRKKSKKKKQPVVADHADGSPLPTSSSTSRKIQDTLPTPNISEVKNLANNPRNETRDISSSVLTTDDPMQRSFSKGDSQYEELLKSFGGKSDEQNIEREGENELLLSLDINGDGMQGLTLEENQRAIELADDDFDNYDFYRTDSFDRFCRKTSPDLSNDEVDGRAIVEAVEALADEEEKENLTEKNVSTSSVVVAPQISEESLRRTYSSINKSISKSSIDKLNDARYDTKTGILLPTLPRRPTLCDATDMNEEINITQNELVLLSVDVFQQPTETIIKVFKVFIGHLAGYGAPFYLLVSNVSVYLLKKTEATGFKNMLCISLDNVNKVQTGLNFQDVFIFHDEGCFHVSTRDEIATRMIISTVKGAIKSSQGLKPDGNEPMASNTYNELDLVIQDWLICHTHVEEPEILHFSLIYYSSLASEKQRKDKVRKAAQMSFRQSNFGLHRYWEKAFFALRGHMLYQYNAKRTDLKQKYDLSTQCGGCVGCGNEDGTYVLKIIGSDGSSSILELGIADESESIDWLMSICQVVADSKIKNTDVPDDPETPIACGLVLTPNKIFLFNQDPKSGRLVLEDSCVIQNITQVCVDNHTRTYCTLAIDNLQQVEKTRKTMWLFDFQNEYELGKFEQTLHDSWQCLYQVPLQFVLLADQTLKKVIQIVLNENDQNHGEIGNEVLYELLSN